MKICQVSHPDTLTVEDQLCEIQHYIGTKFSGFADSKPSIKNIIVDTKFSAFVNLGMVDVIYRDFFVQGSLMQQVEAKNRCFKDLYNILEESIAKFHNLFLAFNTSKDKITKYEETFRQLDTVFS